MNNYFISGCILDTKHVLIEVGGQVKRIDTEELYKIPSKYPYFRNFQEYEL
jgi:hypothetical protein